MRELNAGEIQNVAGGMAEPIDGLAPEIAKKAALLDIDVVAQAGIAYSGGLATTAAYAITVGTQVGGAYAVGYGIGSALNTYTPIQGFISDHLPDPKPPQGQVEIVVPNDSWDAIYKNYDGRNGSLNYY